MRKLFFTLILGLFLISLVSAEVESYQVSKPINLQFTCTIDGVIPSGSTTFNISIYNPDGSYLINNQQAESQGSGSFNYTVTFPEVADCYKVKMICVDGTDSSTEEGCYKITPSGFLDTFNFYLLICLIVVGVISLGFLLKEEWFIMLGGMALLMLGVYTINSGFVGFKDMYMTWGISIFEIAVGALLTIIAGWSKFQDM